jgi:8-amino-7-oxononanoate synthase
MNRFQKKLKELEAQNRLRSLTLPGGLDLTSNDYLGLRRHEGLREAAIRALQNGLDLGAGGSRLLRGHTSAHADLEEFAADYFSCERTLYFATGFQANHALFTTLPDRHDTIIYDELVHASVRDAIASSHARAIKIRHNDLNAFEDALKAARLQRGVEGTIWMAVESVYSMDGDFAPLEALHNLSVQYDAMLVIDEAHGTGVFGASGKGLSENIHSSHVITLHTCGKALGVAGGLVCGAREIIDYLVNRARGFIYSTAPIPLQAMMVHEALKIARDEPWRREKLMRLIKVAAKVLPVDNVTSQIIPVILGSDARVVQVASALQQAGFDVRAIRPPSVPEGSARLRLSLNCDLDETILKNFADHLAPHLLERAA